MDYIQPSDLTATCHNGGRSHFNAWFFDFFDSYVNYVAQLLTDRVDHVDLSRRAPTDSNVILHRPLGF